MVDLWVLVHHEQGPVGTGLTFADALLAFYAVVKTNPAWRGYLSLEPFQIVVWGGQDVEPARAFPR